MTRFLDGPAKDAHFMIRRTPIFVRVTQEGEKFDILNEADDRPRTGETLFAYVLTEKPGICCVRASGSRGGIFQSGTYRFCDPQPDDNTMRRELLWTRWVHLNIAQAPKELTRQ